MYMAWRCELEPSHLPLFRFRWLVVRFHVHIHWVFRWQRRSGCASRAELASGTGSVASRHTVGGHSSGREKKPEVSK